jgi:hypothetical protein
MVWRSIVHYPSLDPVTAEMAIYRQQSKSIADSLNVTLPPFAVSDGA